MEKKWNQKCEGLSYKMVGSPTWERRLAAIRDPLAFHCSTLGTETGLGREDGLGRALTAGAYGAYGALVGVVGLGLGLGLDAQRRADVCSFRAACSMGLLRMA